MDHLKDLKEVTRKNKILLLVLTLLRVINSSSEWSRNANYFPTHRVQAPLCLPGTNVKHNKRIGDKQCAYKSHKRPLEIKDI